MHPIDIIKQHEGITFTDEDGDIEPMSLLPPLSPAELDALEKIIPCPLPDEARELLAYTRGFNAPLESVDFSGLKYIGPMLEEVFPCALPIAHDGAGNHWVVNLTEKSTSWGPILYFCHDPAVIVFQTDSLAHFIAELIRSGNKPWKSEIDDVYDRYTTEIYLKDPWKLTHEQCLQSNDPELADFARTLGDSHLYYDLRSPRIGMGFPWGRVQTYPRRSANGAIYAIEKHKSLWKRMFG